MGEELSQNEQHKRVTDLNSLICGLFLEAEILIKPSTKRAELRLDNAKTLLDMAREMEYFPKRIYQELSREYNSLLWKITLPKHKYNIIKFCKILESSGVALA